MQQDVNNPLGEAPEAQAAPGKRKKVPHAQRALRRGQIEQRGENRYLVRVYLGQSLGEEGKRRRHYFNKVVEGTRADAENFLVQHLEMRRTGRLMREPSKQTLEEFLREYYFEITDQQRRAVEIDWRKLETHVLPELGSVKLKDLTPAHFQSLYKRLRTKVSDATGKTLSPTTQNHVHRILMRALNYAHKDGLVVQHPLQNVVAAKPRSREFNVLSRVQAVDFLAACDANRDARANRTHFLKNIVGPVFHLALETGMRPEEFMALKESDITFDAGPKGEANARVRRALVRYKNTSEWEFSEPKTLRSKRLIPLSPQLALRLKAHLTTVRARRLARGAEWREHGLVFPNNVGEPLHEDTVRRLFKQNLELAGLEPSMYRLYDLRHTCATLLLQAETHPKVVQERLGHSSISITLDLYSHFVPSMQADAMYRMSGLLYGGTLEAHFSGGTMPEDGGLEPVNEEVAPF